MIPESQAATNNFRDHQDSKNEVYSRKRAARTQADHVYNYDNAKSLMVQTLKKFNEDSTLKVHGELRPPLRTKTEPIMCEERVANEKCMDNITGGDNDICDEAEMDMTGLSYGVSDIQSLGSKLEGCIGEVQFLEQKNKELQAEVIKLCGYIEQEQTTTNEEENSNQVGSKVAKMILRLKETEHLQREKSKMEIAKLKDEQAQEERKLWRVNIERQGLHKELWRLKRKFFVVARECAQSQATLGAQQQHVEQLKKEEEKLQTAELQLKEERNKLEQKHLRELLNLQEQLSLVTSRHLSVTQEELDQCRRDSHGDVQQYLQDSLKAVEERYKPILMSLLKRRDTAADALTKVKEQAQELRVQLTPLREEIQKLVLQKVCLEEKLRLVSFQRKEEMGQYKDTVSSLEEICRELKVELRIQNTKTNEMKDLKERLDKQLTAFRSGDQVNCDKDTI
ncbi:hypothetical protein WMY93_019457 [Mugilogobius chulae]|uniref:IF rod domain-containing protein n=1 Tax=Mugilogobius chulae TaxID=88201 RepID=A0AAW0NIG3_9GOBI